MLGLSLTKILFTILIVVVIWKGFGLIGRLARDRQARAVSGKRGAQAGRAGAIELIECARCGAYFDPKQGCRCGDRRA